MASLLENIAILPEMPGLFFLTHIHGALKVLRSTLGLLGTYQCKAKNVVGWHHDICIKINVQVFYAQKRTPYNCNCNDIFLAGFCAG